MFKNRKPHLKKAFSLLELIMTIAILSVLAGVGVIGLSSLKADQPPNEEVVEVAPPRESGPTDLTGLWVGLGIVGGIAVLGGGAGVVTHQVRKGNASRKVTREAEAHLRTRWRASQERHKLLEAEYGAYLLDLQEIFKRPALSDATIPETSRFIEDYASLGVSTGEPSTIPAEVDIYEQKVSQAWEAWRVASAKATKLGLGSFTSEERKKVERASQLLKMAMDAGASEFERAQAYLQVQKLVDGLILVPEITRLQIEAKVRPQLPMLKSDDPSAWNAQAVLN